MTTFRKILSAHVSLVCAAVLASFIVGCGAPEDSTAEEGAATAATAALTNATVTGTGSVTTAPASATAANANTSDECNKAGYACVDKCNKIPLDWNNTYNRCISGCILTLGDCLASVKAPPSSLSGT